MAFINSVCHCDRFIHYVKKILPGLVLGLVVGAYLVDFSILNGAKESVTYVVETIADPGNINIIAFLYLFGGLIGMMQISGGVKGFSEWASEKIGSERGLLSAIWLTLPFTFMMPMFRIMMIGPVVKSLLKKVNMSSWKVGFTMDISTSSVIVLLPAATAFVGFMVSIIEGGIQKHNLEADAYEVFLSSIPYNFWRL
ncbi:hypothetical protein [Piscibacillus salipiscarius]|uniref:hypothetical protein n=1 Tax=Piscibacillus salipiscarius TaxID=299480 RepID=UPI0034E21853